MKTEIISITPDIAEKYLGKNESNRNLSKSRVSAYSRDMKEGRWRFNPNPIVFDNKGVLIDGQHRLHAVIEAGTAVDMFVMFDAPSESKDIIDFGKPRTAADILRIEGYADATNISALAKRIIAYETGMKSILNNMARGSASGSSSASNMQSTTKKEVVDYCRDNIDQLAGLIHAGRSIYEKSPIRLLAPSEIGFFIYALKPQDKAFEFMSMVVSGVGLQESTPELAMRRLLERVRFKKDLPITSADLTKYFFVAFEKYDKGEPCEILRLPKK